MTNTILGGEQVLNQREISGSRRNVSVSQDSGKKFAKAFRASWNSVNRPVPQAIQKILRGEINQVNLAAVRSYLETSRDITDILRTPMITIVRRLAAVEEDERMNRDPIVMRGEFTQDGKSVTAHKNQLQGWKEKQMNLLMAGYTIHSFYVDGKDVTEAANKYAQLIADTENHFSNYELRFGEIRIRIGTSDGLKIFKDYLTNGTVPPPTRMPFEMVDTMSKLVDLLKQFLTGIRGAVQLGDRKIILPFTAEKIENLTVIDSTTYAGKYVFHVWEEQQLTRIRAAQMILDRFQKPVSGFEEVSRLTELVEAFWRALSRGGSVINLPSLEGFHHTQLDFSNKFDVTAYLAPYLYGKKLPASIDLGFQHLGVRQMQLSESIYTAVINHRSTIALPGKMADGQPLIVDLATEAGRRCLAQWQKEQNNEFQAGQVILNALNTVKDPALKNKIELLAEYFGMAMSADTTDIALPGTDPIVVIDIASDSGVLQLKIFAAGKEMPDSLRQGLEIIEVRRNQVTNSIYEAAVRGRSVIALPGKMPGGLPLIVDLATEAGRKCLDLWQKEQNNEFQAGQIILNALNTVKDPALKNKLERLAENYGMAVSTDDTLIALPGTDPIVVIDIANDVGILVLKTFVAGKKMPASIQRSLEIIEVRKNQVASSIYEAASRGTSRVPLPGKYINGQPLVVDIATPEGRRLLSLWEKEQNNLFLAGSLILDALNSATNNAWRRKINLIAQSYYQAISSSFTQIILPGHGVVSLETDQGIDDLKNYLKNQR